MLSHRPDADHPHLIALVTLLPYAAAAHAAGWSDTVTLTVHLLLTLLWFGLFERWRPHRPTWRPARADLRRDATFLGVNALADGLAGVALGSLALQLAALQPVPSPIASWPLWAAVPLAVLAAELAAYALHRALHREGWGWRVHLVHHRPGALHVTNNFTTHPINVVMLKAAKLAPLALLGFGADAVLLALLFLQLQSFATHANTRGRMGWLNRVVGTAELHRWHHSTRLEEAMNFATALPLWDQVFGTYRYLPGQEPQAVGISPQGDVPDAHDIRGLLRFPLRRPAALPPAQRPVDATDP